MDRRSYLGSAVALSAFVAGCAAREADGDRGGTPTSTPTEEPTVAGTPTMRIRMIGRSYDPLTASVDVGATVEWVNEDAEAHDVRSARFHDGAASWDYDSGTLLTGGTTAFTFREPGVYEYYCALHGTETMCGAVVVGGASLVGPLPCADPEATGGGGHSA